MGEQSTSNNRREQGQTETPRNSKTRRIERLEEENKSLRERVENLETVLTEIRAELTDETVAPAGDEQDTTDESAIPMTSGGQPSKVVGEIQSEGGIGVYGSNVATSGETCGVMGKVSSPSGTGAFGEALVAESSTETQTNDGTEGETRVALTQTDTNPTESENSQTQSHDDYPPVSGRAVGVYGRAPGEYSYAIAGSSLQDPANEVGWGNTFGVYGQTDESTETHSLPAFGVVGYASSTSGEAHGISGRSDSPDGAGVLALNFGGGPALVSDGLLEATERSIKNTGVSLHQETVQTIENGAFEVVDFDTKEYDDRGSYDLDNNKFVAPMDGRYHVVLSVGITASVSARVDLLVNDDVEAADIREGSDEFFGLIDLGSNPTLMKTLDLAKGDEVVPYVRHYSSDPEDTDTDKRWTFMTIEQVS